MPAADHDVVLSYFRVFIDALSRENARLRGRLQELESRYVRSKYFWSNRYCARMCAAGICLRSSTSEPRTFAIRYALGWNLS